MTCRLAIPVLLGLLALSSCKNDSAVSDDQTPVQKEQEKDTLVAKSEVTSDLIHQEFKRDSKYLTFEVDYQLFREEAIPYRKFINDFIYKDYLESVLGDQKIAIKHRDSTIVEGYKFYSKSAKDVLKYHDGNMQLSMNLFYEIEDKFDNFATITVSYEAYEGGAHGNRHLSYETILKSDNPKVLKLSDVVKNKKSFTKAAEKYFIKAFEEQAEEKFEYSNFWFPNNQFELNDNFQIHADKITFVFNPYEYTPYVYGTFVFDVPMQVAKDHLKIDVK